jgi:hypothetical protein
MKKPKKEERERTFSSTQMREFEKPEPGQFEEYDEELNEMMREYNDGIRDE